MRRWTLIFFLTTVLCRVTSGIEPALLSGEQRIALFESLHPRSLNEMAAFAELFPESREGKVAQRQVWTLLSGVASEEPPPEWPADLVHRMVNRFVLPQADPPPILTVEQRTALARLRHRLHHLSLKGRGATTEEEVLALPPEEIDLARGLLLAQGAPLEVIEGYEQCLDLMALQVMAQLPEHPAPLEILRALNHYIFVQQRFRFPPHSRMALEVDQWTLLSQVMDRRKGVCQGVSQLYLCLAQRLGLPLEVITPPGHIYVRYHDGDLIWNIETTAHGIHLPTHAYLGLNTKDLSIHTLREVVGMSLFNAAAVPLYRNQPEAAVALYQHARRYMGEDPTLLHNLGSALFAAGQATQAKEILEPLRHLSTCEHVIPSSLIGEILDGHADAEALALLREQNDASHAVLREYAQKLLRTLERCPHFLSMRTQLAYTYLQMGRLGDALTHLRCAYDAGSRDLYLLYLLTEVDLARLDVAHAAQHVQELRALLTGAGHLPPILERLEERILRMGGELSLETIAGGTSRGLDHVGEV